jgi:dipeptidyl-peptidase 4
VNRVRDSIAHPTSAAAAAAFLQQQRLTGQIWMRTCSRGKSSGTLSFTRITSIFRPMKKTLILWGLILTAPLSWAQKQLTLEEAVLGQTRQFMPEQLAQLSWIPDTDDYVQVRRDSLVRTAISGRQTAVLTLAELRMILGKPELKSFPALHWISEDQIWFESEKKFVTVALKSRQRTQSVTVPENAANTDFHAASGNLAFTRENNLFVYNSGREIQVTRNEPGIVSGQSIARNEYGISKGTFWNPSGSALAWYEKDERNVTEYPLTDYSVTPASVKMIRYPMAGQAGEIPAVGVIHVQTGEVVYLDLFGNQRRSDQYYATNLAWAPDGGSVLITWLNRKTTQLWLRQFDALTGKEIRTILTEQDDKWLEPLQPVSFVPGNAEQFIWHSWREGFHNFYLYTLSGKLIGKTAARFELDEIIGFDGKGGVMYALGRAEDPTQQHAYAVNLPSMRMTRLTPAAGTHEVRVSKSGYILDTWSSVDVPNRVDLTRDGKVIRTLLNAENKLSEYDLGRPEIISLMSTDSTRLYARVIRPSSFDPEAKYPAVVYVYNGPHVQLVTNSWLAGAPLWMYYLAELGYVVFTVDGRGSAHRGKAFEQSVHRSLGSCEIDDQAFGVHWLRSQPWIDASRIGIHGWSYGGFMTTSLMLRMPELFKAGVAGGPVIDWKLYEVMYTERYMDTPDENPEGYERADLTRISSQLEGKLLMIHGTDDDVVVMQHNMRFIKSCIDNQVQVDFFAYPGHAHNVRGKDRLHLIGKVIEYLNTHLE